MKNLVFTLKMKIINLYINSLDYLDIHREYIIMDAWSEHIGYNDERFEPKVINE
jgi:hypothetical protein